MATTDPETTDGPAAGSTPMRPHGALRCSDAERERTSAALHEAVGEGRLTLEEAEERLAEVYTARYDYELDALVHDLPRRGEDAGWRLVVALARQQLVDDVASLAGRDDGTARRQRLAIAAAAVVFVLVLMASVLLALHGIVGDGLEHGHGFH
jgi:hypothetical protein